MGQLTVRFVPRPIGAGAAGQSQQSDGWDHKQQSQIETSLKRELTFHVVTIGPTCARRYGSHVAFCIARLGYSWRDKDNA
jgi:hypothetical protein